MNSAPYYSINSIRKLLNCQEKFQTLLIEDSLLQSYVWIVTHIIKAALEKQNVLFVGFDLDLYTLDNYIVDLKKNDKFQFLDGFSIDKLEDEIPNADFDYDKFISLLLETLEKFEPTKTLVIIDSINTLLNFNKEPSFIYGLISKISKLLQGNLILLYHNDVPSISASTNHLNNLEMMCGSHIKIQNFHQRTEQDTHFIDPGYLELNHKSNYYDAQLVDLTHNLTLGKVVRERTVITYNNSGSGYEFLEFKEYVDPNQIEEEIETKNEIKQMENELQGLSFNLKLTDKQREDKDNLVLPYLATDETSLNAQNQDRLGWIHYHHDKEDDFDEEDPDDDLEI